MKTYSVENLSENELRLLTESLLFSASTSVNAKWYSEDDEELMDLAIKLRKNHPEVLMKNIFILEEKTYHDKFSKKIIDFFPEIEDTFPIEL